MADKNFRDDFLCVLNDMIREQVVSNYIPRDTCIISIVTGDSELYRRITCYPELNNYAITSSGFIFRDKPLALGFTANNKPYVKDVYGLDFYNEDLTYDIPGDNNRMIHVDPMFVMLYEFFGFYLNPKFSETYNLTIADDWLMMEMLPFLTPLEDNLNGTREYFKLRC